jgi:hypothetical protein
VSAAGISMAVAAMALVGLLLEMTQGLGRWSPAAPFSPSTLGSLRYPDVAWCLLRPPPRSGRRRQLPWSGLYEIIELVGFTLGIYIFDSGRKTYTILALLSWRVTGVDKNSELISLMLSAQRLNQTRNTTTMMEDKNLQYPSTQDEDLTL